MPGINSRAFLLRAHATIKEEDSLLKRATTLPTSLVLPMGHVRAY